MDGGEEGAELLLEMLLWSDEIVLFTGGHPPAGALLARLEAGGVRVEHSPVAEFFGVHGNLTGVVLENGQKVGCDHVFLAAFQVQHDSVVEYFGLNLTSDGKTDCGNGVETEVPRSVRGR